MKILVSCLLVLSAAQAFAAADPLSEAFGSLSLAGAPAFDAPAIPAQALDKAAASWSDEVKKVYKQQLESGRLFALPALKKSELPAAAQRQLDRDNASARTAAAYKLTVKNRPAYVVHNKKDGRSSAAHIFESKGKLVAVAKATASSPLYWENLGSYTSGSGGYYGPDDVWDGFGGQGPSYGGPDDTYDGGGYGGNGGFNGNSGGPDDTNYGGI